MNRETKRMMQRQGEAEADPGESAAPLREEQVAAPRERAKRRSLPGRTAEYFGEVRSEMRQVAWPTREEVVNSSTVVLLTLVLLVALIFLLNFAFSHGVNFLFKT